MKGAQPNPLQEDLDHILAHTGGLWDELRGKRIFITGGTGFFGCWLLESFAWANTRFELGTHAVVLTRDPKRFASKFPWLAAESAIEFCAGDITSFDFPDGEFSHIIHAATETDSLVSPLNRTTLFDANINGTRRVLEFAKRSGAHRLLFTSSGAVYGKQPSDLSHIPEEYNGAPDPLDPFTAYGQSKRVSEFLCAAHAQQHELQVVIARCFAFVGPHLPFNLNYAIGNFLADALRGGPIRVNSDGSAVRSYLYAADLAVWLWTLLFRGQSQRAYNVGSDSAISIAELARQVANIVNTSAEVIIANSDVRGTHPSRYVPSIARARKELGLESRIDLCHSVEKTANWYRVSKHESL